MAQRYVDCKRSISRANQMSVKKWRIHNDSEPLVSIIIPAMNESRTLAGVLYEASKVHPCSEIIVVANGSHDGTEAIASGLGARVLSFAEPLGHDVGRRIGAEAARGEILLFIDADMIIPAKDLKPFVISVSRGVDVALNHYSGPVGRREVHSVVLAKHTLNVMLSRRDLGGCSLTAVPHALSRKALNTIGYEALEIPPLAHAIAIKSGLQVLAVHRVPVGKLNKVRNKRRGIVQDPLKELIEVDHLKAIAWLLDHHGERAGFSDLERKREKVR